MRSRRLQLRTPLLVYATRGLTLLLAGVLIWYGAMVVLLAAKVAPHTVNSISAYRTIYDFLAKLRMSDFSLHRRLAGGFGGALAFLALIYLALQELPRPYVSRQEAVLVPGDQGSLTIGPRAIERLAEIAALMSSDVSSVSSRLGEETLSLSIGVCRAQDLGGTLSDVRRRVSQELARQEIPALAVNVTVTRFEPTTGRNLS
jgi:hypothetical protein